MAENLERHQISPLFIWQVAHKAFKNLPNEEWVYFMALTDEDILKFQTLYKSEFGMEISREEAYEQGIKLVRFVKLIYKPMTEEEYEQLQKRRQDTLPLLQKHLVKKQ